MFRMPLFDTIGSSLNKLLTYDYQSENQEFRAEWKSITKGGVFLSTAYTRNCATGAATASVSPSYFHSPWRTWFRTEVNTNRDLKVEAESVDLASFVPGATATVTGQIRNREPSVTTKVDYQHEYASLSASADLGKKEGSTFRTSALTGVQNLRVGCAMEYFASANGSEPSAIKETKGVVAFVQPDFELHGTYKLDMHPRDDVKSEVGLGFFHQVNRFLHAGAQLTTDVNKREKAKLTVGCEYRMAEDTVVKAKADTDGIVSAALLAARWNANTSLQLSGTFDTKNLSGKDGTKIGVLLSLNDESIHFGHTHAGYAVSLPPTPPIFYTVP